MTPNFEPHECVIFVQSTEIGTHKNKAIHSMPLIIYFGIMIEFDSMRILMSLLHYFSPIVT